MSETESVSFAGQQIVVMGHRGAGKSTWIQYVLNQTPGHFIVDMNREHEGYNRYLPEYRRGDEAKAEVDGVTSRIATDNDPARRPSMLVYEEANRYIPNRGSIPEAVGEVVDLGRHYETDVGDGIAVMYVTRRPSQLDTDVIELADYLVVYRVRGKNDKKRLNSEASGLGDKASQLGEYEYLLVRPDRSIVHMSPVPEGNTTGSL